MEPLAPITTRQLLEVERRLPHNNWEKVVVTVTTAHQEVDIRHSLRVPDPEALEWVVTRVALTSTPAEAPVLYRFEGDGRRPWSSSLISLRGTVPGQYTVVIYVPR